jgi:hypothetical protein
MRDRKQTNIPLDLLRELMIGGTVGDGKTFDSPVWRTAYFGHNKVFIIDEAELLDPYGQNALLKTLEEPPAGTYIFLVTTQEERLLPTIRSRCQRVAFRALDAGAMQAWFDRAEVPAEARVWLAEFSEGAPGAAELAHKHGLRAWSDELLPRFAAVEDGRFDGGLADRLAELVGDFAERVVKENPKASKEAAFTADDAMQDFAREGEPSVEDLIRSAIERFDWHSKVTVSFVGGDGGAAWSRSSRTITVNGEYVRRFVAQGEKASAQAPAREPAAP